MTINKRVRILRTEYLKISQEKFGKQIGLKRTSIDNIEREKCKLTDRNLKAICDTHNVREEWLRTGEEPIFLEIEEKSLMEQLTEEFKLSATSKHLLETYLGLSKESQKGFEDFVFKIARKFNQKKTIKK